MDRTTAFGWAVDLLTGSLTGDETGEEPPPVADPILRARAHAFRSGFADLSVTVQHLMVDGDWIAVRATGRGRHTATFQGCPATGRSWTAVCMAMFQLAEGQIIHGWVSWDLQAILEQIGAVERSNTVSA